ncbi:MAG: ABC transporter permease [Actinomycetota bacterium]
MTTSLAIAALEIKRFLRERITLFTTLLMPSALMLIIGTAFAGGTSALPVGLLDDDGTAASAEFAATLEDSALSVTAYTDLDAIARDIRLGFLAAGVHVPAGFADGLAGDGAEVVMTLDQTSTDGAAVAAAITATAAELGQVPTATRVGLTTLGRSDEGTRAVVTEVAEGVVDALPPIDVSAATVGPEPMTGSAFASAMYTQLTLFIFLNGMLAGIPLVESRRLGVARRMLSTPTGVGPHLLGVGLGRWGLGLIQAGILLGLGVGVFGVGVGHWPTALTLVLLWCALGAAVGMLLGAVGRTPDQVVAWSVPLGIGMGMLGGAMWPLSVVPPFMRTIGHLTPHAWAIDAWDAVVNDGARFGEIGLELGILAAVTAVLGVLSVVLLRRSLSR